MNTTQVICWGIGLRRIWVNAGVRVAVISIPPWLQQMLSFPTKFTALALALKKAKYSRKSKV